MVTFVPPSTQADGTTIVSNNGVLSTAAGTCKTARGTKAATGIAWTISGLAFRPQLVVIFNSSAGARAGILIDAADNTEVGWDYQATPATFGSAAIDITSDGFIVNGANYIVNAQTYSWIAYGGAT